MGQAVLVAGNDRDAAAQLVFELGSRDFAVRQRALLALEQAGPEVIELLAVASTSDDVEVRARALKILLTHSLGPVGDARDQARAMLQRLTSATSPRVAQAAREMIFQVREVTVGRAVAELTRLGATVMPVQTGEPFTFNVQIRQTWTGGDEKLSLLESLEEVPWLSMENSPVTDAALVHVAKLSRSPAGLTKLYLGSSGITGSGLANLAPLKKLQYLSLKQLPIDDTIIAKLPDFPALQYLGLDGTKVGDEGLKAVGRYLQLQVIWLDNTAVTDAGLVHLKSLTNLRTLYVPGTNTAGPGIAELRHLPNLTSISLKSSKLSPESLKHVAQLEQLESLGLDYTNVTDEQLSDLSGLSRLRILWLSNTRIGDAGAEHLKSLKSLQIVHLSDTQVTSEGATELQRALPACQVTMGSRFEQSGAVPRNPPPRPALPRVIP
jgi:Leucine-rich repeat (LRR) protein